MQYNNFFMKQVIFEIGLFNIKKPILPLCGINKILWHKLKLLNIFSKFPEAPL